MKFGSCLGRLCLPDLVVRNGPAGASAFSVVGSVWTGCSGGEVKVVVGLVNAGEPEARVSSGGLPFGFRPLTARLAASASSAITAGWQLAQCCRLALVVPSAFLPTSTSRVDLLTLLMMG